MKRSINEVGKREGWLVGQRVWTSSHGSEAGKEKVPADCQEEFVLTAGFGLLWRGRGHGQFLWAMSFQVRGTREMFGMFSPCRGWSLGHQSLHPGRPGNPTGQQGGAGWRRKADSAAPAHLHIQFSPNRARTAQPGYKMWLGIAELGSVHSWLQSQGDTANVSYTSTLRGRWCTEFGYFRGGVWGFKLLGPVMHGHTCYVLWI